MIGRRWVVLEDGWCLWDRLTRTVVLNMVERCRRTGHDLHCRSCTTDATLKGFALLHDAGEDYSPNQVCYCWDVATWEDFADAT